MGVPGLWQLLEPSRRVVDLEQFRGKRMAIDMNIWLHQALKSRVSTSGNINYHLAILFRRICKLLFYGIRPVFVFDGAVPTLKKTTMAARHSTRQALQEKSLQARNRLLKRLFHRLAESAIKSKNPSVDLTAEFVRRFNNTEAMRKAEQDAEMFGSKSAIEVHASSGPTLTTLELEEEQKAAFELARDFLDNCPPADGFFDFESEAYTSLPIPAQLQVIRILQDRLTSAYDGSPESSQSGEAFSTAQVNKLIMRRDLTRRKVVLQQMLNEKMVSAVVPKELVEDGDIDVTARRIASQDKGHTILLRRRSSKELKDEIRERLQSLIETPIKEAGSDDDDDDTSPTKPPQTKIEEPSDFDAEFADFKPIKLKSDSELPPAPDVHVGDVCFEPVKSESDDLCVVDDVNSNVAVERDSSVCSDLEEVVTKASRNAPVENIDVVETEAVKTTGLFDSAVQDPGEHIQEPDLSEPVVDVPVAPQASESEESDADDFEDVGPISQEPRFASATSSASESDEFISIALPSTQVFLDDSPDEDQFEFDDDFLRAEADKFERQAQDTSTSCLNEAQRLVTLFGLPIVQSPEEAEAQCCSLQASGLVDVVASDDSDVWLFGATCVCRHLFGGSGKKKDHGNAYLYSLKDIYERLGLDRAQFLRIALLCGSDYTRGIPKVGPVTALEILAEFASSADAVERADPADDCARKHRDRLVLQPLVEFRNAIDAAKSTHEAKKSAPRRGISKWRNLQIPVGFPSETVVEGYLYPRVESLTSADFRWDVPNLSALVKYPFEVG
ncbi:unnamed protein product [Mesocestoides corti]|uniref:XPG N-terminal domain-containing protein n=1 Tax=Mesocestoides corti TaxID=53468 RepID=A0A158QVU0_MESCO|nr:unnamed protein product [Mesocestoides corti]